MERFEAEVCGYWLAVEEPGVSTRVVPGRGGGGGGGEASKCLIGYLNIVHYSKTVFCICNIYMHKFRLSD